MPDPITLTPENAQSTISGIARGLVGAAWAVARVENAGAALDAVMRAETPGNFTDMAARDPRGVGVRGGYPQVNQGIQGAQRGLLEFARTAYTRSAPARVIVDRFAQDQWAEWFDLQGGSDSFRDAFVAFARNPTGKPGGKPLWWYFKRAQRLARRDGRSLVYFGLREAGDADPRLKPANVLGVKWIRIVREHEISQAVVDDDPESEDFLGVKAWRVNFTVGGKVQALDIHGDRVLAIIPDPDEEDENRGVSPLVTNINYVEGVENMLWAALEAYFQEASPWIIIKRDPSASGTLTNTQREQVKDAVASLQQSLTQRAFLHGVDISILQGSGQLANPKPHWDIGIEAYSMATGMPRSIVRGDAAGELASAREDSRRWQGIISKVQEEENDPVVSVLVARLIEWDFESWAPRGDEVTIKWNPIYEEDPKGEAERQVLLADARMKYLTSNVDVPVDLEWEPTTRADLVDYTRRASEAPRVGFAPRFEEALGPRGVDAPLESMQKRLLRVFREAFQTASKAIRFEDAASDAGVAVRSSGLQRDLEAAILEGLVEAARAGGESTLRRLGVEATIDVLRAAHPDVFRTISRDLSISVADRLSDQARRIVAEGLAKGLDLDVIRRDLEREFDLHRYEATRIARTETLRGWNEGSRLGLKSVGIANFRYIALVGADEECAARDGQVYSLEDSANFPPVHPSCRCSLAAEFGGSTIDLRGTLLPDGVALL